VRKNNVPKQVTDLDRADRLMTIAEVAEYCQVHRSRVYDWMRDGRLAYVIVGTRRRVRMSDLAAYLTSAA